MQRQIPADEVPLKVKIEIIYPNNPQQYIHTWPIIVEEVDTMGWQILMQRPFLVGPANPLWEPFRKLVPQSEQTPIAARYKFQRADRSWTDNEVYYHDLQWSYTFSMTQDGQILATPDYGHANTIVEAARSRS